MSRPMTQIEQDAIVRVAVTHTVELGPMSSEPQTDEIVGAALVAHVALRLGIR